MGFNNKNVFSQKNILITFIFLTIINLIYINIVILQKPKPITIEKIRNNKTETPSSNITASIDQFCPQSCIAQIQNATSSVRIQPVLPTATSIPTSILLPTPESQNSVKEFFVPFGTGSSSAGDWEDIQGIQTTIDTANYSSIKSAVFEASIRIPTGNGIAYVRLFNSTDKHPVWFSDVSLEGGTPKLVISKPITLDSGNKTYQVQMKNSLKTLSFIDQARLHIITN